MGIAAILFNGAEPFEQTDNIPLTEGPMRNLVKIGGEVIQMYGWLCWGLTTHQPLRVILCGLPEKGRKEIEERVEEMKERDREERGTGMKVKKQKK